MQTASTEEEDHSSEKGVLNLGSRPSRTSLSQQGKGKAPAASQQQQQQQHGAGGGRAGALAPAPRTGFGGGGCSSPSMSDASGIPRGAGAILSRADIAKARCCSLRQWE